MSWHSEYVIDELWLWIFECLSYDEVFRANRVCRKWKNVMAKYGVVDRHEMSCYFSKSRLSDSGCTEPNASGSGVSVVSQTS